LRTRVGFTGGSTPNPTYRDLCQGRCDHTESIQIDFDPKKVTFNQLLKKFWGSHCVTSSLKSVQYISAIWYGSEEQRKQAEESKVALEKKNGCKVTTKIAPLTSWTNAEDYHQKYYLRNHTDLLQKLALTKDEDLLESTVAAKLNSFVSGVTEAERQQIIKEVDEYPELEGLQKEKEYLKEYLRKNK